MESNQINRDKYFLTGCEFEFVTDPSMDEEVYLKMVQDHQVNECCKKFNDIVSSPFKFVELTDSSSNAVFGKIHLLTEYGLRNKESELVAMRPVNPNRNSFFRSVMISYIEILLERKDVLMLKCIIRQLYYMMSDSTFVLDISHESIKELIAVLVNLVSTCDLENPDKILNEAAPGSFFYHILGKSSSLDKTLAFYLRFQLYKYISVSHNKFFSEDNMNSLSSQLQSFWNEETNSIDFNSYFQQLLLNPDIGVDHLCIQITSLVLNVNLNLLEVRQPANEKYYYSCELNNKDDLYIILKDGRYSIGYTIDFIERACMSFVQTVDQSTIEKLSLMFPKFGITYRSKLVKLQSAVEKMKGTSNQGNFSNNTPRSNPSNSQFPSGPNNSTAFNNPNKNMNNSQPSFNNSNIKNSFQPNSSTQGFPAQSSVLKQPQRELQKQTILCTLCSSVLKTVENRPKALIYNDLKLQQVNLGVNFQWEFYLEHCSACLEKSFYEKYYSNVINQQPGVWIRKALETVRCQIKVRCNTFDGLKETVLDINLKLLYEASELLIPLLSRLRSKICFFCLKANKTFKMECCSFCLENGCYANITSYNSWKHNYCCCNSIVKVEIKNKVDNASKLISQCFKCKSGSNLTKAYYNVENGILISQDGKRNEVFEKGWILHSICAVCIKDKNALDNGINCEFCETDHTQKKD